MRSIEAYVFPRSAAWSLGIALLAAILFYAVRAWFPSRPGLPWDVAWYADIAAHGYRFKGSVTDPQNLAFLPLAPRLARIFIHAFGLSAGNALLTVAAISSTATALLIPKLFFAGTSRLTSIIATACVIFFNPFSVYLFNGYPEAVFVALSVGFFVAWRLESRSVAAFLAGCALLARPHALVLFAAHVLFAVRREGPLVSRWRALPGLLADAPFLLAPVAVFSIWEYQRFGDPLAYLHALNAWIPADIWKTLSSASHWTLLLLLPVMIFLCMTIASFVLWFRRRCVYALVSLMHLAFVAGTLSIENLGRHTMTNVAFAISVGLAAPNLWRTLRQSPMRRGAALAAIGLLLGICLLGFCYATKRLYAGEWVS